MGEVFRRGAGPVPTPHLSTLAGIVPETITTSVLVTQTPARVSTTLTLEYRPTFDINIAEKISLVFRLSPAKCQMLKIRPKKNCLVPVTRPTH